MNGQKFLGESPPYRSLIASLIVGPQLPRNSPDVQLQAYSLVQLQPSSVAA